MDIDVELEKIIEKYDLDKCDPAYRQRKKAQTIIKKIIESFTGKIAVIATFESDINRFQFLLKDNQADYYYCYKNDIPISDSNYDLTYNMSALDDVCFEKYDYIWLVSLEGSVFVKRWLRKHNVNYHFLYDDLELNGCYCIGNWHSLRRDPEIEWWTRRYWSKPGREWITADTMELVSECGYECSENVKINHLKKLFLELL